MKPVRITIQKPCNQSWQEMTEQNDGRFCSQCSKTVVDFSLMSDSEIINYLKTHQQICGRLHVDQMHRALMHPENKRKGLWLKIAAMFTGVFMGNSAFTQAPTIQTIPGIIPIPIPTGVEQPVINVDSVSSTVSISGRVINANTKHQVSWAEVYLGAEKSVRTNRQGYYKIEVQQSEIAKYPLIRATKHKLSGETVLNDSSLSQEIVIEIHEEYFMGWVANPLSYLGLIDEFDPENLLKDSDADGVIDRRDKEPNTVVASPVDLNGVTLDSDKDGCPDIEDPEPYSSVILPVENCENIFITGRIVSEFYDEPLMRMDDMNFSVNLFEMNSDIMTHEHVDQLVSTTEILKKYSKLKLEIVGNNIQTSGTIDQLNLTQRRTENIVQYFVSHGINISRLVILNLNTAEQNPQPGLIEFRIVKG